MRRFLSYFRSALTSVQRPSGEPPVILLSPTQRSGTNYLFHLLTKTRVCVHPAMPTAIGEDFLFHCSNRLFEFADEVTARRAEMDFMTPELVATARHAMIKSLGMTVDQLIGERKQHATIVKTPSTQNIANVLELIPDARIILLYRDGRDTCNSLHRSTMAKSWNRAFEHWSQRVAEATAFGGTPAEPRRTENILWVQYELAVEQPRLAVENVARFLGRDVSCIDWGGLKKMKIYGSSEHGGDRKAWTYNVRENHSMFKPIGRWTGWPPGRVRQFKRIANPQLIDLGYVRDARW